MMDERLSMLREWREWARAVAEAVKRVRGDAEVYVIGGAVEGRLTVLSDIDVLIALPQSPSLQEAAKLRAEVWVEMERMGLPPHLPIELHIIGTEQLARYIKGKPVVRLA
ncbi:nucleotidyltransferase domain-containing protein [Caldivirga maquilingensis]|uniref:DNA polymerase beta domain protein region n=1 Tax=Caldivirga maquilingensis (strain ATCC 700844 / DSM 13496 / JCM 10307 / IC-167) TaxID=397948 RepID=A8M941_CALMQ|nr:nucleotidyltransferase domain-containing protein [Caldivirga maquilingensis]ABW02260.1 DNA polymerase beta domain protein region [Caldivirga maquilingensis IC-167]